MTKILVMGSYNGQDSLGDECLLKCVINRLHRYFDYKDILFISHNTQTKFLIKIKNEYPFQTSQGIQSAMWRIEGLANRIHIPSVVARKISTYMPTFFLSKALPAATLGIQALKKAKGLFLFGGTQYAGQWFELNEPAYTRSMKIIRKNGGKVILTPQQYGPFFTDKNLKKMRYILSSLADLWCTRNKKDQEHLNIKTDVYYDEVFSNLHIYPNKTPLEKEIILVNIRELTFDDNNPQNMKNYKNFSKYLDLFVQEYRLPVGFFSVSDETFCNDFSSFERLKEHSQYPEKFHYMGRIRNEYELINLSRKAKAVISMSFHGCLLSSTAGAPFIPVSEGNYYDYKYYDFDKYSSFQGIPIIPFNNISPEESFIRTREYISLFDPQSVFSARRRASELLDSYYEQAANICK